MLQGLVKKLRNMAVTEAPSVDHVSLADPGSPAWPRILGSNAELWRQARATASAGPRVLLATAIGGDAQFTLVESALAVALTLRGVKVDILLCDQALSACLGAKVSAVTSTQLAQGELRKGR